MTAESETGEGRCIGPAAGRVGCWRRMVRFGLAGLALAGVAVPGLAQEEKEKPAAVKRGLRLLPVGDPPLFRADLRDGVLRERELADGVLPPAQVKVIAGEDLLGEVRVMLGQFSRPLDVPAAATRLSLREAGDDTGGGWADVALPEGETPLLLLLWRDPDSGKWTRARHLVLNDAAEAVPAGAVRVINLTGALAGVRFGAEDKTLALKPGRNVIQRAVGGKPLPLSVAVKQGDGDWLLLYQGEVEPGRGERSLVVIYRSDGEDPRRPAKVKVLSERLVRVSGAGG